jgi:hypothetical protein
VVNVSNGSFALAAESGMLMYPANEDPCPYYLALACHCLDLEEGIKVSGYWIQRRLLCWLGDWIVSVPYVSPILYPSPTSSCLCAAAKVSLNVRRHGDTMEGDYEASTSRVKAIVFDSAPAQITPNVIAGYARSRACRS